MGQPPVGSTVTDPARLPSNFVFSYWRNLFALSLPSTWETCHQKTNEELLLNSNKSEESKSRLTTSNGEGDDRNSKKGSNETTGETFCKNAESDEEIHI